METLTFTAQEINALVRYFKSIPTEWGREPLTFIEKKIMDVQKQKESEAGPQDIPEQETAPVGTA